MKIETRIGPNTINAHHDDFAVVVGIADALRSLNLSVVAGFIAGPPKFMHNKVNEKEGPIILYLTDKPELWVIGPYKSQTYSVMQACQVKIAAKPGIVTVDEAIWPDHRSSCQFITDLGPRFYKLECPDSIQLVIDHAQKAAKELDILSVYSTMG